MFATRIIVIVSVVPALVLSFEENRKCTDLRIDYANCGKLCYLDREICSLHTVCVPRHNGSSIGDCCPYMSKENDKDFLGTEILDACKKEDAFLCFTNAKEPCPQGYVCASDYVGSPTGRCCEAGIGQVDKDCLGMEILDTFKKEDALVCSTNAKDSCSQGYVCVRDYVGSLTGKCREVGLGQGLKVPANEEWNCTQMTIDYGSCYRECTVGEDCGMPSTCVPNHRKSTEGRCCVVKQTNVSPIENVRCDMLYITDILYGEECSILAPKCRSNTVCVHSRLGSHAGQCLLYASAIVVSRLVNDTFYVYKENIRMDIDTSACIDVCYMYAARCPKNHVCVADGAGSDTGKCCPFLRIDHFIYS